MKKIQIYTRHGTPSMRGESPIVKNTLRKDPTSNEENRVLGADFQYVNNEFLDGEILQADVFYQQSDTPGLSGDDASYGFGIRYPQTEGFRTRMAYKVVEENFNPAMGYINRADVSDLTADFGYTYYFDNSDFLQTAFAGVDMQRIELLDGGHSVLLVDRDGPDRFGGLARWAFGGMALVGTSEQKWLKIADSPQLMLEDWIRFGELGASDTWPDFFPEGSVVASEGGRTTLSVKELGQLEVPGDAASTEAIAATEA